MRQVCVVLAALAAGACATDEGAPPPPADTPPAPLFADIASGEYRTDQPGGCAYMTIRDGAPVLYFWDQHCNGRFDFTSRPPTLKVAGDVVYVGMTDTSRYENIRPSGNGFAATQEFRGRRFEVQFNPR